MVNFESKSCYYKASYSNSTFWKTEFIDKMTFMTFKKYRWKLEYSLVLLVNIVYFIFFYIITNLYN